GALTQTFYDESLKFVGIDPSDALVNIIFSGVGSKHDISIVEFIFSDPVALTSFSMKLRKGTSLAVAELDITPVPLPAGLPLMLSALAGFAVFRRRGARVGAR
ncbi:MAG: VPLPA-CTERM sorting domain-containing protein, partial [Neomegalonema sp.]